MRKGSPVLMVLEQPDTLDKPVSRVKHTKWPEKAGKEGNMAETTTEVPATRLFVGGSDHHHRKSDRSAEFATVVNAVHQAGEHASDSAERAGYRATEAADDARYAAVDSAGKAGYQAVAATTEEGRNLSNLLAQLARDVQASGRSVEKDICDIGRNLAQDLCGTKYDLGIAIERNGRSAELATEKTAASITLQNQLIATNTQNLMINGFKDARFDAATHHADLAAKLAECCCELKEKIAADGESTRALVNTFERDRAARDFASAQAEIAYLRSQLPFAGGVAR